MVPPLPGVHTPKSEKTFHTQTKIVYFLAIAFDAILHPAPEKWNPHIPINITLSTVGSSKASSTTIIRGLFQLLFALMKKSHRVQSPSDIKS